MNASTFAFRPCQGIAWNYFVLNCDIARAQSLGIKVCDIAAQCSELNTVVFVTSKPNIHDDSIFWGQVIQSRHGSGYPPDNGGHEQGQDSRPVAQGARRAPRARRNTDGNLGKHPLRNPGKSSAGRKKMF